MVIERGPRIGPRASLIAESIRLREQEATSEVLLVPSFDILTISGPAGTGKTTVALLIEAMVLELDSVKIGQDLRFSQKDISDYPVTEDVALDSWQEDRMRNGRKPQLGADPQEEPRWRPIQIEGRLSGAFGARVADEAKGISSPRIFRVLFTYNPRGDQTGRYERILPRERKRYPYKTDRQIIEDTERRDREFVEKIHMLEDSGNLIYANLLHGMHPYDPNIKTGKGNPVYNLIIDTKDKTVADVFKELMGNLLNHDLIRPLGRADFGEGPLGDTAYQTVAETSPCDAFVQGEIKCGRYATRTLDSYVMKPGEKGASKINIFPACSSKHSHLIRRDVEARGNQLNMQFKFGKNGMPIPT